MMGGKKNIRMIVTDLGGEFTPVNMQSPTIPEGLTKFMKA